jgi:hypothetical protein
MRRGDGSIIFTLLFLLLLLNDRGCSGTIIFYGSPGSYYGNMGSRATVDAFCFNLPSKPSLCTTGGATATGQVLSYSVADSIAVFPSIYGFSSSGETVEGPTGIQIAPSWTQLVAGGLVNSLYGAGVTGSPYWTGADSLGLNGLDCNGWTTGTYFSGGGAIGNAISLTTQWLTTGFSSRCSYPSARVCFCRVPPTSSPTKSPSSNPTQAPTRFPTFQTSGQLRRWMLKKGNSIYTPQGGGNATKTPLEMEITGSLVPVMWKDLNWTLYAVTQPPIPLCNPIPTQLPGGVELDQLDRRICPTLIKCNSTLPGPPFQSLLRACVLNYTVVEDGPLEALNRRRSLFVEGGLTELQSPSIPQTTILCNSAIDREINCQFKRQNPLYELQCQDEPIQCYQNETIGRFFGLFQDQNPNFQYPVDPLLWTDQHYMGVASILNNLTYFLNGKEADPLTQELLNSYYWLPQQGGGGGGAGVEVISLTRNISFQPDVLQLEPYNWYQIPPLPPPSSSEDPTLCLTALYPSQCQFQTFENQSFMRGAGLWFQIPSSLIGGAQWVNFTTPVEIEGAELYLNETLIWQHKKKGTQFQLPSTGDVGDIKVRLLGLGAFYDLPSMRAGPFQPPNPDPLFPLLSLGIYGNSYYPLFGASSYQLDGANIGTQPGVDFPYLPYGEDLIFNNISVNVTTTSGGSIQWQPLADLILQENIYPTNFPLQEIQSGFQTRPTNLTLDKPYLYKIWASHLARRYATEDVDCQTFQLGPVLNRPKGDPGGCQCDPFWDPSFFCSRCLPGLGGPLCSLPYQPLYPGQPQQFFPSLVTNITLPPQGVLFFRSPLTGKWKGPLCHSIYFESKIYPLGSNGGAGVSLTYVNGSSWISFIYEQIYIDGVGVPFTQIQFPPFTPVFAIQQGEGGGELLTCNSPLGSEMYLMNPPLEIDLWWWIVDG